MTASQAPRRIAARATWRELRARLAGDVVAALGPDEADAFLARIETALFADLVLRETVVKAASLAHGVRRALGPEPRNRIRFEMRQELRSARKRRLRLRKELLRQARAAERARLDEGSAA